MLVIRAPLTGLTQDRYRQDWAGGETSSAGTEEGTQRGRAKLLRCLPANLSRHEIAAELPVPVNTVSPHIRSIDAKLQVSDRSSAVQRAGGAAVSRRASGKPDRKSPGTRCEGRLP
jgi:DNA-binding NarL/FixJ family response regulator